MNHEEFLQVVAEIRLGELYRSMDGDPFVYCWLKEELEKAVDLLDGDDYAAVLEFLEGLDDVLV